MTVFCAVRMCQNYVSYTYLRLNPAAALCKAWVCRRSLAGTTGSNPEGDMDICLLCFLFQVEVSATGWSLVQKVPSDCGALKFVWWLGLDNEELAH